jgi:hypothetical protein
MAQRVAGRLRLALERVHDGLGEYLKAAQPRLIVRVEVATGTTFKRTPHIREVEDHQDEVLEEGYDPYHSPLGCPVYWRVVKRGDQQFYCSTFEASRDQIKKVWGSLGLVYCDHITGRAVVQLETVFPRTESEAAAFASAEDEAEG